MGFNSGFKGLSLLMVKKRDRTLAFVSVFLLLNRQPRNEIIFQNTY